ncbi:MAG: hypothetical protein QM800_13260 [Paludibacter sp.]
MEHTQKMKLAREVGFKEVACITAADLEQYFSGRSDNLSPASGEVFLIAST